MNQTDVVLPIFFKACFRLKEKEKVVFTTLAILQN